MTLVPVLNFPLSAGNHGSKLRRAFFDCFSSYAVAVGQLWSNITSSSAPRVGERYSADLKLLVLHSNCVHTRTHILRELSNRWAAKLNGQQTQLWGNGLSESYMSFSSSWERRMFSSSASPTIAALLDHKVGRAIWETLLAPIVITIFVQIFEYHLRLFCQLSAPYVLSGEAQLLALPHAVRELYKFE